MYEPRIPQIPDPVQWHEGMLLAPQHFQQLSTRIEFLTQQAAIGTPLAAWGAHRLSIDSERLLGGMFCLREAQATFRDGMKLRLDPGSPLEIDLKPFAAELRASWLYVYLAVPVLPDLETQGDLARYRSAESAPVRDATGESEITLPVLRPKACLWVGSELPARLEGLRLARIRLVDEAYVLDGFHPPSTALHPGSSLRLQTASLAELLREKALVLAERLRGGSLASDLPELWQTRMQLRSLTASLPALEALLALDPLHPQLLFLKLADLAGDLAALSPGLVPPLLPAYDHDDPGASLVPLLDFARQTVTAGISEKWQKIRLAPGALHGEYRGPVAGHSWLDSWLADWIETPALRGDPFLVLGLRPAAGSPAALRHWAEEAVICGAAALDTLLDSRTLGLARQPVDSLPGLAAPAGTSLFVLDPDPLLLRLGEPLAVLGPPDREVNLAEAMLFVRRFDRGGPSA